MNRNNLLLLYTSILLISTFLTNGTIMVHSKNSENINLLQIDDITAIITTNDSFIIEGETIEIYLIIKNPTLWKLYNLSYTMTVPHKDSLEIIWVENTTDKQSFYDENENNILLRSNISIIERNTTLVLTYRIKFLDEGIYEITCSDLTFTKVLGEIKEASSISGPDIVLTINKIRAKWIPPEGNIPSDNILLIGTIVLPLVFLFLSNKIHKVGGA
ncbi:MAG: hypothetical protein ACTSVW_07895 [Candidatus Njordarchaeales archaeon]